MSNLISRLFFPTACPLCGSLDYSAAVEKNGCCPSCQTACVYPANQAKVLLPDFAPSVTEIYCCSYYGGKMKEAMERFKCSGETYIGPCFGRIAYGILEQSGVLPSLDVITAVPVSSERFRERGYNQSLFLSREISRCSGVALLDVLERKKQGISQSRRLLEERGRSSNPFALRNGAAKRLAGKTVLLIDDILTTGRTVEHCAFLLKEAGAICVLALCITGGRREFT